MGSREQGRDNMLISLGLGLALAGKVALTAGFSLQVAAEAVLLGGSES